MTIAITCISLYAPRYSLYNIDTEETKGKKAFLNNIAVLQHQSDNNDYWIVEPLWLAAIMARFSCSYVTNITTFQEPRRKKDGMNLKSKKNIIDIFVYSHWSPHLPLSKFHLYQASFKYCPCGQCLPFIKGKWSFFGHHVGSAVEDTAVLAKRRVHESCLDHVDWGGDHCRAQPCAEGWHKVAGQIVCRAEAES